MMIKDTILAAIDTASVISRRNWRLIRIIEISGAVNGTTLLTFDKINIFNIIFTPIAKMLETTVKKNMVMATFTDQKLSIEIYVT